MVETWIKKGLLHFALLLIVIVVKQRRNSCNVVNWTQKIILHLAVDL